MLYCTILNMRGFVVVSFRIAGGWPQGLPRPQRQERRIASRKDRLVVEFLLPFLVSIVRCVAGWFRTAPVLLLWGRSNCLGRSWLDQVNAVCAVRYGSMCFPDGVIYS